MIIRKKPQHFWLEVDLSRLHCRMDLLGETVLQTEDHQTGCSHCSQQSNNYYINYSLQKKTTLDYVGCYVMDKNHRTLSWQLGLAHAMLQLLSSLNQKFWLKQPVSFSLCWQPLYCHNVPQFPLFCLLCFFFFFFFISGNRLYDMYHAHGKYNAWIPWNSSFRYILFHE